ncbi:hypothetical protein ACHAXT_005598 [Thalassiosira profunda]
MGRKKDCRREVRLLALKLNNELPADLAARLLHGGVDRRLTVDDVHDALQHCNIGEILLKRREQQGISYFRSAAIDGNEVPLDQRFKCRSGSQHQNRVFYNPPRGYFASINSQHLPQMHKALDEVERLEEAEAEKRRNARQRRGRFTLRPDRPGRYECSDIGPYGGNCIMSVSRMEDFVRLSTNHAAGCGGAVGACRTGY